MFIWKLNLFILIYFHTAIQFGVWLISETILENLFSLSLFGYSEWTPSSYSLKQDIMDYAMTCIMSLQRLSKLSVKATTDAVNLHNLWSSFLSVENSGVDLKISARECLLWKWPKLSDNLVEWVQYLLLIYSSAGLTFVFNFYWNPYSPYARFSNCWVEI